MAKTEDRVAKSTTKKKLSPALKYLYGIGDAGFNLMSNVETFYFMSFLTNTALFGPVLAALISTTFAVVDACLSWIYGGIIDGTKAKKWGRYRSWLVMLPWIVPFIYLFMFVRVSDSEAISAVVIIVAGIVSHFLWNIPYVANVTLISVVGKTPEDRATLSSSRGTWNNIGAIAFSYLGMPLAMLLGGIVGNNLMWAATAFVLGLLMVFGYYCHFKMTDGYEEIEPTSTKANDTRKSKVSIKEMFSSLFQNAQLMLLMVIDLAKWCVKFVTGAAAIYYFRDAMANPDLMPPYLLAIGIAAAIGAFVLRYFARRFSNRTSMIVAMMGMAVSLIVAYLFYDNAILVIAFMTIANFFYGMSYSASPALYADTVVYATWKTGKNAAGWIMGLQNLPLKLGVVLRGPILSACLVAAGWQAGIVLEGVARQGMMLAFSMVPGIFCIVAAFLLLAGYKLTKSRVDQYQAEIDAREAQTQKEQSA